MNKYQIGDYVCFSCGIKDFPPISKTVWGRVTESSDLCTNGKGWWYNITLPNGTTTAHIHRCMIGENAISESFTEEDLVDTDWENAI